MSFKSLVKYSIMVKKYGYFVVRCKMLKEGATLEEVHQVLSWNLRILGS